MSDYVNCEAHGCPLLGVVSTSTTGGGPWYCWMHFRSGPGQSRSITYELERNVWLVQIVRGLRRSYAGPAWARSYRAAQEALGENARPDLRKEDAESVWNWIRRLEVELFRLCSSDGFKDGIAKAKDLTKVHFDEGVIHEETE